MRKKYTNIITIVAFVIIFIGIIGFTFPSNSKESINGYQKLPVPLCLPQVVNAKNKYYILSQGNSEFFRNTIHFQQVEMTDTSIVFFEFNPATAILKKISVAPMLRSFYGATFNNGKIYLAGGYDKDGKATKTFMEFDIAGKKWNTKPNMTNARNNVVIECYNNKIYALSAKNPVEVFDLTTNQWHIIDIKYINNIKPLTNIVASTINDDKIYLFGNDGSFQIYAINNNTIENGPQTPFKIDFFDVVTYNRKLYLASGANGDGIDKSVYMFSTVNNTWSVAGKISVDRCGSGLAYFGSMLFFIGGSSDNIINKTQPIDDIFIYRPSN